MSLSGTEEDYLLEKAFQISFNQSVFFKVTTTGRMLQWEFGAAVDGQKHFCHTNKVKSYDHTQPLCLISMKIRIPDFVCHLLCFTAPTVRAAVQKWVQRNIWNSWGRERLHWAAQEQENQLWEYFPSVAITVNLSAPYCCDLGFLPF